MYELSSTIELFGSGGTYLNGIYEQRASAACGSNYDRLVEIATAYAPTNFLRYRQSIVHKTRSSAAY